MPPKVSIIVPVYKVEPFLEKCAWSIINQTYHNLEIILVDDGSPDQCPQICDELVQKDSRIIVIHQKNKGLPKARRSGYNISSGSYIFFVDSDDYLEKDTIKILVEHALKNKVDIVVAGINNVFNNNKLSIPRLKPGVYNKEKINDLFADNFLFDKKSGVSSYPLFAWGKLIRKDVMDGYFEVSTQFRYWEDIPSTFYLTKKIDSLEVVENNLYNYVIHANQVTKKPIEKIWHFYVDVWNYLDLNDEDGYFTMQLPQRIWKIISLSLSNKIKDENNYTNFKSLFKIISKTPIVKRLLSNKKILELKAPTYKLLHFFLLHNLPKPYYLLVKYDLVNKFKRLIRYQNY